MRDPHGVSIRQGQVNVQLNTFNSFVDITGLPMGIVYSFGIENPIQRVTTTAIISTIDPSLIKVIDENACFTDKPTVVGDIVAVLHSSRMERSWQIRFPPCWPVMRNECNGIAIGALRGARETFGIYAYAPTAIYTRNRDAASHVDYTPFRGLSVVHVPIRQIPTIMYERNYLYSINPPSRVRVTWRTRTVSRSYESSFPVDSIDVEKLTSDVIVGVKISALFD